MYDPDEGFPPMDEAFDDRLGILQLADMALYARRVGQEPGADTERCEAIAHWLADMAETLDDIVELPEVVTHAW